MIGAPVVIYQTPYNYIDRNIDPSMIADSYKVPIIFSSLQFHNRLCLNGMAFKLESIDGPADDTKKKQIEQALKQIKQIDKSFARIGRHQNCTTLDCMRVASLEVLGYRQCLWEKTVKLEKGNLYVPRLQHLPSQSFNKTPTITYADSTRYQVDGILPGIVWDTKEAEVHFFQNTDSIKEPTEIPADQVLLIEDKGVPNNSSVMHSVLSTIEFMKQARHDFRLAMQRVGIPKMVAEVDGGVLAQMQAQNITINGGYQTLVDYCNNMVRGQSTNQAEVALPGIRFKYPSIPIALDPMAVEKFIEQIILNHFFAKGITEQLAQAVSVSAAPGKALLDGVISGHQEVVGNPFTENIWQTDFLDLNGFDLVIWPDFVSWAPKDTKAESEKHTTIFAQGGSLVNDYRAAQGLDPYTPVQLKQLFEEQNALKRGKLPGEPEAVPPQLAAMRGNGQEAKAASLTPEEQAAQEAEEKSPLAQEPGKLQQSAFQSSKQLNDAESWAEWEEGGGKIRAAGNGKERVIELIKSGKTDNETLAKEMGFTKTPAVLSNEDFEKEIAKGDYEVGYRGLTSAKNADAFEKGEYFTGAEGVFGEGIYVASGAGDEADRSVAEYFAKSKGVIEKIAIPKDANIIDGDTLRGERQDLVKSLKKESSDAYSQISKSNPKADYKSLEKKYPVEFKEMDKRDEVIQRASKDDGYAAKLLGYDAVKYDTQIADKQMLVLNRGILKTTRIR